MLDIKLFREDPKIIKESEKKRFRETENVDEVIRIDNEWREVLKEVESLKANKNRIQLEISKLSKEGKDVVKKVTEMKKATVNIEDLDRKAEHLLNKRDELRRKVGNLLHKSVPKSNEGEVVRKHGKIVKFKFTPKAHADLIESLDIADVETAAKVTGARFYYLKNELVKLNLALIQFVIDKMTKKGYTPFWTPYMLAKPAMSAAAELGDFEESLYKIEGEDLFLIATAEQTLATLHMNQTLNNLPRKYVAYSSCFRREAGAHGKDTKGIFRVHQFDKVEQFIFCASEDSWKLHEELIHNAEEIFKDLEIPYQIVNIGSGDMNDNAAKKYDLEGWFPAQGEYRELCSCSNCTDYQARKLNVRSEDKQILHTLNSTAIATERAICAILENHQQKDGSVKIPKALWKYTGFKVIK